MAKKLIPGTRLHSHDSPVFKNSPVMAGMGYELVYEYIQRLYDLVWYCVKVKYNRTLVIRLDLHFPDTDSPHPMGGDNRALARFWDSLKAKLTARQKSFRNTSDLDYAWAREQYESVNPHYHLLILVDANVFRGVGRVNSKRRTIFKMVEEAWASALGYEVEDVSGLIERCETPEMKIHKDDGEKFAELLKMTSYLTKIYSKDLRSGMPQAFGRSHWYLAKPSG